MWSESRRPSGLRKDGDSPNGSRDRGTERPSRLGWRGGGPWRHGGAWSSDIEPEREMPLLELAGGSGFWD